MLAVYRELQKMETQRWFIRCLGKSVVPLRGKPLPFQCLGVGYPRWLRKLLRPSKCILRIKVLNQDRNVDVDLVLSHLPQRSVYEALDNSISREEVDEAVSLLKNSKAPGDDGMPNEIWKIGGVLTDYLVGVCNHALEGEVPKEWVDYIITQFT